MRSYPELRLIIGSTSQCSLNEAYYEDNMTPPDCRLVTCFSPESTIRDTAPAGGMCIAASDTLYCAGSNMGPYLVLRCMSGTWSQGSSPFPSISTWNCS